MVALPIPLRSPTATMFPELMLAPLFPGFMPQFATTPFLLLLASPFLTTDALIPPGPGRRQWPTAAAMRAETAAGDDDRT